jgi:serine/threonine protein kinase
MYGRESDLWALGVVAYELANFYLPFELEDILNPKKFVEVVQRSDIGRKWMNRSTSKELKDLVDGLLQINPSSRLGANRMTDIKEHSFFKDFNWQDLESRRLISPLLTIIENKENYPSNIKTQNNINSSNDDALPSDG